MKKNILSLVAFMAFSISAFANTVEVKEEVVEVKEEVVADCYAAGQAAEAAYVASMKATGGTPTNAGGYAVFAAAYEACEKDSSGAKKNTITSAN